MAEVSSKGGVPVVESVSKRNTFLWRELNGATFLSLEHLGHMVLVVVVAVLIACGIATAINLWTGNPGMFQTMGLGYMSAMMGSQFLATLGAQSAVMIVSALLVLVPILVVLDRRTRAEWQKRKGYANRLAYKLPVYGALAVLVIIKVALLIQLLNIVITSLAMIGSSSAQTGPMFMNEFLPALVALAIFATAGWYVFKLAKGRDMGQTYSAFAVFWGIVISIALLITAVVAFHNTSNNVNLFNNYNNNSSDRNFQDLFRY